MRVCPSTSQSELSIVLTIPNLLTFLRLTLAPLIVIGLCTSPPSFALSFSLFLCASLSDFLDGWIARRWQMTSVLGAWLDPLADKLLLVATCSALAWVQVLPVSLVVAIIVRDFLIVGGVLVLRFSGRPFQVNPLWISKANTLVQMTLITGALMIGAWGIPEHTRIGYNPFVQVGVGLTWITTVISGFAYAYQGWSLWSK